MLEDTIASPSPAAGAIPAGRREVAFRGGGFLPVPNALHSWIAFAVVIALWQVAISQRWIDPVFLPSPVAICEALWNLTLSGDLWRNLSVSLLRIGVGWAIGTGLGLFIGIAMGLGSIDARRRHADDIGDLSHSQDRPPAAVHPVARHR